MLYNTIVFIYLLSSSTLGHLTLIFPGLLKWRMLIHIITSALLAGALIVKALRKPMRGFNDYVYFFHYDNRVYSPKAKMAVECYNFRRIGSRVFEH